MRKPVPALAVDQFDRKLNTLRPAAEKLKAATPKAGWIRAIRTSLGMSTTALAERLGIAHTSLLQLEKGEQAGTISLASLRRVAEALDAEVVYALVPRASLKETVSTRARQVARQRVGAVAKSMQLEAQGLTPQQIARQIDELARDLEMRPKQLWR